MNGTQNAEITSSALDQIASDPAFQDLLLQGVSRTFALTIPQLPEPLCQAVSNAYLLCRIIDTIEDETAFDADQKRLYCNEFIAVVKKRMDSREFAEKVAPLLSSQTIPAEHALMQQIPRVISITHGFAEEQQAALARCVETMAGGMPEFQDKNLKQGLASIQEMDRYCYYVAGCVGEMLTELFCHYDPVMASKREEMLRLAVSFGQGLQMTNILKDIWDDQQREVCWLPQEVFSPLGFRLAELTPQNHGDNFQAGLLTLVAKAHQHLEDALSYTLMIPSSEPGIRKFCLWAVGMAVLTLKKVSQNTDFTNSSQVKISRRSVKATIATTNLCVRSDTLLKLLFKLSGSGINKPQQSAQTLANRSNG